MHVRQTNIYINRILYHTSNALYYCRFRHRGNLSLKILTLSVFAPNGIAQHLLLL